MPAIATWRTQLGLVCLFFRFDPGLQVASDVLEVGVAVLSDQSRPTCLFPATPPRLAPPKHKTRMGSVLQPDSFRQSFAVVFCFVSSFLGFLALQNGLEASKAGLNKGLMALSRNKTGCVRGGSGILTSGEKLRIGPLPRPNAAHLAKREPAQKCLVDTNPA